MADILNSSGGVVPFARSKHHSSAVWQRTEQYQYEKGSASIQNAGTMAVTYCSERAIANGFSFSSAQEWANLGQAAPETGFIVGSPTYPDLLSHSGDDDSAAGVVSLRYSIAYLYNETYRQGKQSQYTHENVFIASGGRSALGNITAAVGDIHAAHHILDDITDGQSRDTPIAKSLNAKIRDFPVVLVPNPHCPKGEVIQGEELRQVVELSREKTLIFDEYYSWYIYPDNESGFGKSVSAAAYVEDVNENSVVIIDGFIKNWRFLMDRICWIVGPKWLIDTMAESRPFFDKLDYSEQEVILPFLDFNWVATEKIAVQTHFKAKRDHVLQRLEKHSLLKVDNPPTGGFFIWLNIEKMPAPLNDGITFFEALLKEKTMIMPGIFFDVNPAHRQSLSNSPYNHFVRLSFGPPLEVLDKGLDAIDKVVANAQRDSKRPARPTRGGIGLGGIGLYQSRG